MLDKNYTNPSDRGRFGFSESGEYHAPYKSEHIIVSFLIAGIVVFSVLIFLFFRSFAAANIKDSSQVLFMSMAGAVGFLLVEVIILLVGITLIKFVMSGFVCKYIATDDRFTVTVGDDTRTIYYKDVQNIHFQPRNLFRKVQGYDVTIKINGVLEEYSITADNYISPKTTPFYIIKERMEMARQAEYAEQQRAESTVSVLDPNAVTLRHRKTVMERLDEMVGEDVMPSVGVTRTPPQSPETAPEIQEIPQEIQQQPRVSPTVGGYSADMPAVQKEHETYVGLDGRATDYDEVLSRGTFCVAHERKITLVLTVVIAVLLLLALGLIFTYISISVAMDFNFLGAFMLGGWMYVLGGAVFATAGIVTWRMLAKGAECRYKANGRDFTVYRSKHADEHILYADVMSVAYKPRKILWFDHGYDVQIVTRFGTTEFHYVFPKLNVTVKREDTPFDIITVMKEKSSGR